MRNTFWDKRIPTLLSLLLIGISIALTSLLVKSSTVFVSSADITQTPQNVKITNISDNSLTISYTTDVENIASVNFGTDKNLGQIAIDDRDQGADLIRPHKVHNFTLKNLKPNTRYFFTITVGENTFLNNSNPYETTTAPRPQITLTQQTPIKGKIILPTGESPKEAIVYVNIDKKQAISSLSKTDGTYFLSLNSLLLQDLSYPATLEANDVIKMIVTDGNLKSSVLLSSTQINPVPVITLSYDYDFTQKTVPIASKSAALLGFSSIVLSIASVSANPTLSPIPTSVPTPTTVVPPITQIPTPTPINVVLPTITPETPLGSPLILIVGIFGLSIIALGYLLFIKTRGNIFSK